MLPTQRSSRILIGSRWLVHPGFLFLLLSLSMTSLIGGDDGPWQNGIQPHIRVSQLDESDLQRFLGNESHTDYFKLLEQDGESLLVGARNIVYNISLSTLMEKKRLEWFSSYADISMCKLKGKSETECQNYIRVLARKSEDVILVCGTNAFKPMCRNYRQTPTDYIVEKEMSGEGLCPYDPNHNSTAIFAGPLGQRTDGDLYVATVAQFSGADPLIYREPLRTEQFNFEHLNAPSFVSSIHHEDYVYFFFRETAVEYINCGKTVYSRVARVCTKDKGGPHKFRNRWTSFLKARLNCSLPGEFPFYFNEIQSTSHIVDGLYGGKPAQLIYAVFTTPTNSISGSAVCAFRLEDILKTFDGPFKGHEDVNFNWLPVQNSKVPEPRPGQCVNDSRTLPEMTVNFIKNHNLMDQSVPAFWGKPLVIYTGFKYRYTYIAVDPQVETANGKKYDVLFIGTDNGKVIKALNAGSDEKEASKITPVIVEEMLVFPQRVPITNLLVYHTMSEAKLVVVSQDEILTIPLHNCDKHARTCSACVALRDPYCAWDINERTCTSSKKRIGKKDKFVQNVANGWDTRCPEVPSTTPIETTTQEPITCPPCPVKCVCPGVPGYMDNEVDEIGRPLNKETSPQRSPHQSASRHDNHLGGRPVPQEDPDIKPNMSPDTPDASRDYHLIYTAETLAIAVTSSIVSSLVVGFISGYIFSRRCRNEEMESPYDEGPYLEPQHNVRMDPHLDPYLSRNNKPINLVLNVPNTNSKNSKTANSSADNKPVDKVKKIYL
ncbi:semaphorin-1A-like isoform X3 [Stegodyphus dumicola]|uniref:semaphorin-1A-like isoform X3 n=1 Tax=Stegodyphus dumicola TaxID=202533 RepID=UPI0015A9ECB0|nr:semaphorin-1A-like isoform X3 [Stegodyphus dumicola]